MIKFIMNSSFFVCVVGVFYLLTLQLDGGTAYAGSLGIGPISVQEPESSVGYLFFLTILFGVLFAAIWRENIRTKQELISILGTILTRYTDETSRNEEKFREALKEVSVVIKESVAVIRTNAEMLAVIKEEIKQCAAVREVLTHG